MFENFLIKKYSDNPNQYKSFIEIFRKKTFQEGNESISYKKYDPDDQNIETWMVFNKDNDLISISVGEKSHYTNDPDIALRICRYNILKPFRRTHCGLMMAEYQIQWAREHGYQILYITHDGITDHIGQSQIAPYLLGISKSKVSVFILSVEKKINKDCCYFCRY